MWPTDMNLMCMILGYYIFTDAMGIIEALSPIGKIPWVKRQWEGDYESSYLTFTIKDTL